MTDSRDRPFVAWHDDLPEAERLRVHRLVGEYGAVLLHTFADYRGDPDVLLLGIVTLLGYFAAEVSGVQL